MRRCAALAGLLAAVLVGCSSAGHSGGAAAPATTSSAPAGPARVVTLRVDAPTTISGSAGAELVAKTATVLRQRLQLMGVAASVAGGAGVVTVRLPGQHVALPPDVWSTGTLTMRLVANTKVVTPPGDEQSSLGALTQQNKAAIAAAMGSRASAVLAEYIDPGCPAPNPVPARADWAVMCDSAAATKFLLMAAVLTNAELRLPVTTVTEASTAADEFAVDLAFTNSGQTAFTAVTRAALGQTIAFALDNTVLSAATINAVIPGDAEISGLTEAQARRVAALLNAGPLPAPLAVVADQQSS